MVIEIHVCLYQVMGQLLYLKEDNNSGNRIKDNIDNKMMLQVVNSVEKAKKDRENQEKMIRVTTHLIMTMTMITIVHERRNEEEYGNVEVQIKVNMVMIQ